MPRAQKPIARLGWLVDGEWTVEGRGPNRVAADAFVDELQAQDALGPLDGAQVMAAQMLAAAVDSDPTNASLWGQYRDALDALKGLQASGDDDAFTQLLAELGAPTVRHSKEPQQAD